jgi:uncharacterized protein (TIGR02246 family)
MKAIALGLTYVVLTTIFTNAAVANTASDEQAVRKVLASFDEAFNRHDADAVSALFTDDAEFVNVAGMWWRGRAEIKRGSAFVLANIFQNTRLQTDSVSVRFPTRDAAAAVVTQHTVGAFVLPDGTRVASTNNRLTYFLVKKKGRWMIAGGQNTEIKTGLRDPSKE